MSLHRPRFTVRRLMVAVAIVGLILGFEVIRRRRVAFLDMARLADHSASVLRSELTDSDEPGPHGDPVTMRRVADYCDAIRRKYELAARYPWLPVPPDPPEPK